MMRCSASPWHSQIKHSLIITCIALLSSEVSATQISGTCSNAGTWWNEFGLPGADNTVQALGEWNGRLVASGKFRLIDGVSTEGIAIWDGTQWSSLPPAVPGDGINSIAQVNGDLIVGGTFSSLETPNLRNIAKWDGQGWSPLGSGLAIASKVLVVTEVDGALIAAGTAGVYEFNGAEWLRVDTFSGQINVAADRGGALVVETGGGIWQWGGTTWTQIGQLQGTCTCIVSYQGQLFVGGNFVMNGESCYLAKYDGAAWHKVNFPNSLCAPSPRVMCATSNGLVIGIDKPGFLLFCDGTQVTEFQGEITGTSPGADCPYICWDKIVLALREYNGNLIVGGNFFRANALPVSNIVGFTPSEAFILGNSRGLVTGGASFLLGAEADGVLMMGIDHACVHVGGYQYYELFTWEGLSWRHIGYWSGPYPYITMSTVIDGRLYFAGRGNVSTVSEEGIFGIAEWDGQQWTQSLPFYGNWYQLYPTESMYSLARYNSTFVAGGEIPSPGSTSDTQVGILHADVWEPLGASFHNLFGGRPRVAALTEFQGDLVAGGTFDATGATLLNNVALWNGTSWAPMGQGLDGAITCLVAEGAQLFASGDGWVARWNGVEWQGISAGLAPASAPVRLSVEDGCVLMTGMALVGREKSLLRWNGSSWEEFIYGGDGVFGKFNGDYYFSSGAQLLSGQTPARWISSGVSGIEGIQLPRPGSNMTVSAAPNPTAGVFSLSITGTSAPSVALDVVDIAGRRIVSELKLLPRAGRVDLSTQALAAGREFMNGVYFLRVSDGSRVAITKLVVCR